jgi:predicted RND superfamily exporter protein
MENKKSFWMREEMSIIKHPWTIILIVILLTGLFGFFMVTKTRMDNDVSRFLPEDNPIRILNAEYEYKFGSSSAVMVSLTANNAFSKELVAAVAQITRNSEKINNAILRDLLKKIVTLKDREFKVLFNFLLTEMGRQDFALESFKKSLTDKNILASKLGVSLGTAPQGASSGGAQNVDPDDMPANQSSAAPSNQNNSGATRSTPADPDDSEQQEIISTTPADIEKLVAYFKENDNQIEKIFKAFTIKVDRRNKFKSTWIDDVQSFADNDYAIIEFADKTKFYTLFKDIPKADIDLVLLYCLETNIDNKEKLKSLISDASVLYERTGISREASDKIAALAAKFNYKAFFKQYNDPDNIQVRSDKLIKLKKGAPITRADLTLLRNRVQSWDFNKGALISYDGKSTSVIISFAPDILNVESTRAYDYILKIINDAVKDKNLKVHIAGEPVATILVSNGMIKDISKLFPFVVLVVILFLYFSFRHLRGVLLPMATVLLSVIWAMGFLGMLNIPLNLISSSLPTLLVAVGSAYGIHIVNDFYLYLDKGSTDKDQVITNTIKKVGLAVILAGLTTVAGFGSNIFNEIAPIKEFGIGTSAGVFFALLISLFLIPAILKIGKMPKKFEKQGRKKTDEGKAHKALEALGRSTYKHRWTYLVITVVLIAVGIFGASRIIVDMNTLDFFRENAEIRVADRFINKNFGGTNTMTIVFKVKESCVKKKEAEFNKVQNELVLAQTSLSSNPDDEALKTKVAALKKKAEAAQITYLAYKAGVIRPEFLRTLEALQEYLAKGNYPGGEYIGKTISIADMAKRFNQTYNYGNKAKYLIPDDIKVANYYFTQFTSDTLKKYLTDVNTITRMIVQIKSGSNIVAKKIKKASAAFLKGKIDESAYQITFTGMAQVKLEVNGIIMKGQIQSIGISLVLVFLIIILAYKTLSGGLISLVPLSFTILGNFALMGFSGIRLEASTALVASIAIGIGVDYTIHYINTFKSEGKTSDNIEEIIEHTTSHSGRAILINAFSVTAGFAILLFSNFKTISYMGLLIAFTMVLSSLASITIMPALLSIIKPKSLLKKQIDNGSIQ